MAARYLTPLLGISHKLARNDRPSVLPTRSTLSSRVVYASAANKMQGGMVNQADVFPDLDNPSLQDQATEAIHRLVS